jgi:hypothetical protein
VQTKDPRVQVTNFGPANWRTVVKDDLGDWAVTGPPYPTRTEALTNVDRVVDEYFGDVKPDPLAPVRANLASLNEVVTEMVTALAKEGIGDAEFAEVVRTTLRDHSWALGFEFQGQSGQYAETEAKP